MYSSLLRIQASFDSHFCFLNTLQIFLLSNIVRDEGKISRKLMECINSYLIKDGPNLGCKAIEIHSSVQEFMIRCWLTTHDRGLKVHNWN